MKEIKLAMLRGSQLMGKDLIEAIHEKKPMLPSFWDGLKCQEVLEAVSVSAKKGKWISI